MDFNLISSGVNLPREHRKLLTLENAGGEILRSRRQSRTTSGLDGMEDRGYTPLTGRRVTAAVVTFVLTKRIERLSGLRAATLNYGQGRAGRL
jgi:hypothetical protein